MSSVVLKALAALVLTRGPEAVLAAERTDELVSAAADAAMGRGRGEEDGEGVEEEVMGE